MSINTHSQTGISLIEILVTITITVVGLVGLASMQMQSLRANQSTNQKAQAIWIVSDLASRIRANSQGNYSVTNFSCGNSVSIPDNNIRCAPFFAQNSPYSANAACTANQLAAFDRQDVLCGFPQTIGNNDILYRGSASFLARPTLTIQPLTTPAGNVQITLSWTVRDNETNTGRSESVSMVVYR